MKKKTKILAAAIMIFSLMITVQQLQPQTQPEPTDIPPVSSPMQVDRDNTPLAESKAVVADGSPEISTQNQSQDNTLIEIDFEPPATADGKEVLTESSIPRDNPTPTHAPSKNTITTKACEPQMGDTRIVNGQKQSYFLISNKYSTREISSFSAFVRHWIAQLAHCSNSETVIFFFIYLA